MDRLRLVTSHLSVTAYATIESEEALIAFAIEALYDLIAGGCAGNAMNVMYISFLVLTAVPNPHHRFDGALLIITSPWIIILCFSSHLEAPSAYIPNCAPRCTRSLIPAHPSPDRSEKLASAHLTTRQEDAWLCRKISTLKSCWKRLCL